MVSFVPLLFGALRLLPETSTIIVLSLEVAIGVLESIRRAGRTVPKREDRQYE